MSEPPVPRRGRPGRDGSLAVRLAPVPASVARARTQVRELLRATDREDLTDTAVLLVSELVTNALLHAGTEIDLAAAVDPTGLRVEVGDGSVHLPARRAYGPTAGTGRGLLMLESAVDDWGVTRHPHGKTVWFHVSEVEAHPPAVPSSPRALDGAVEPGSPESVPVELRNMPLLLHAAWQEYAEALLREYLLASLEGEGVDPIQMHADATDAIAVLEEHVPAAPVPLASDAPLIGAVEPSVSAARIELPVPRESVAHFETLDRAIEAALDLSREGLVLAAPTQPEVETFRRWMCREVLRQAAGGSPEPWSVPEDAGRRPAPPPEWDPRSVTEAPGGVVAADQGSTILAVSTPAAALLGYDDPGDLVGARLVTIIPERYRQAHLAGLTMYLLVGRRPLLDRVSRLPALRADGSEVAVELLVREHPAGEGRSVLIADIRPAGHQG